VRERALDHRGQLRQVEQIRLDERNRIGPDVIELGLEQPRFAGRCAVMEHQVRAGNVHSPADRRADTLRAAGDQHAFPLHPVPPVSALDLPESSLAI